MNDTSPPTQAKRNAQHSDGDTSSPPKRQKFTPPHNASTPTEDDSPSLQRSSTQSGGLILYLVCTNPLVSPRDLIPLRAVSKSYRDDIDRQLFRHLRIKAAADSKMRVSDVAGRKLPGFESKSKPSKNKEVQRRLQFAVALDIENPLRDPLASIGKHLVNVQTIRIRSDKQGLHMYQPPCIGKAGTMIVFPTFLPRVGHGQLSAPKVPKGVTKLVQHLTTVADSPYIGEGRGPVLFEQPGPNVNEEVWVFTNYEAKISWDRLGRFGNQEYDTYEVLFERLCDATISRLNSGKIDLTLVDHNGEFGNLLRAYRIPRVVVTICSNCDTMHPSEEVSLSKARDMLNKLLTDEGANNLSRLHLKTWDEYAATLTKEEQAMEALPKGYAKKMVTIADQHYPFVCQRCGEEHDPDYCGCGGEYWSCCGDYTSDDDGMLY